MLRRIYRTFRRLYYIWFHSDNCIRYDMIVYPKYNSLEVTFEGVCRYLGGDWFVKIENPKIVILKSYSKEDWYYAFVGMELKFMHYLKHTQNEWAIIDVDGKIKYVPKFNCKIIA